MIDLHTHSTVSDGSEPPAEVVRLAAAAGCRAVALTDHDSLDGLDEARTAAQAAGVTLVPGCEVSCRGPQVGGRTTGSAHVLVYFADDPDRPLAAELARLRQDRQQRNHRMTERLRELGIPIDPDAVVARAGRPEGVGRPHIAAELVALGAADDIPDAFDRWLADGRPAHVPKARLQITDVAASARASGGVAVLAHPHSLGLSPGELEGAVAELAAGGLVGIEAIYGAYRPDQRRELAALARRHGLVATGGSDFHGSFKPDLAVGRGLGDLEVPDRCLEELTARRPT